MSKQQKISPNLLTLEEWQKLIKDIPVSNYSAQSLEIIKQRLVFDTPIQSLVDEFGCTKQRISALCGTFRREYLPVGDDWELVCGYAPPEIKHSMQSSLNDLLLKNSKQTPITKVIRTRK